MINLIEDNEDYTTTIPDPKLLGQPFESFPMKQEPKEIKEEYEDINFENTVNIKPELSPFTLKAVKKNPNINVCIKPARKTSEHFLSYFPKSLYCQPYKYDVSISLPTYNYQMNTIQVGLIDSETMKPLNSDKPSLQIEKITETNHPNGTTDILIRFYFILCSFHHFKRAFIFSINLISQLDGTITQIYTSDPFHTYARKTKDLDVWSKKRKNEEMKEQTELPCPKKIVTLMEQHEKSPIPQFVELDFLTM